MKERLEYVLAGRDELTRPLKRAENQMKSLEGQARRTGVQMNQFGGALTGAGRDLRKFAMGGLQQAGYQIGDYAVQVANGTSKMQAFGQQAPQLLQIFGPLGAVVGAAVSVFAAFAVVAEKTAGALGNVQQAMKDLRGMSDDLAMKFQMIKFGVDTEAEAIALRELAHLHLNYLEAVRVYKETDSLSSRLSQAEDIRDLKAIISNQQKVVDELAKRREAVQLAIGLAEKYNKLELAHARILGDQKRAAEASLSAYTEYYTSRVAAHQMALREEAKQQQIAHGEQLKLMGETMQQGISNAARIKQAYAEYYASRILGEKAAREAAEGKSVKGGRGQDPRQFTYLDEFRKQLKAQEDARTAASRASSKAAKEFKINITELSPEINRLGDLADHIGMSFENAFMSAVDGSMKAKDAFKLMAVDIIRELYRVFVVKQITGFITNAVLGATVGPMQGPTMPNSPRMFAGGGYTGNGARAGGMDGKGGFMAMLHPRETVVDHTRGQSAGVTVVQNINVSTGVQQTVRTEIKSLMPQIAESAKAAVADAKRRGGSYGRAFA